MIRFESASRSASDCDPDAQLVVAKTWSEKAVPLLRREYDEIGEYLELLKRRQKTPAMEFMQLRLHDYRHILRFFTTLVEEAGTHLEEHRSHWIWTQLASRDRDAQIRSPSYTCSCRMLHESFRRSGVRCSGWFWRRDKLFLLQL